MSARRRHETLLTLTELPTELTVRAGAAEELDLPSLAGGGYVWEAEVEDDTVAEASTAFRPASSGPGRVESFSRTELLTIRGLRVGSTRLQLAQRRSWERSVEAVATHTLTIDVVSSE